MFGNPIIKFFKSQIQHESQQSKVKYLEELLQLTDRRFSQHAALEADRLSVKAELAKARPIS